MKKAFVWDPIMRSSAIKYDPCIVVDRGKCKTQCVDCKVTLIADRFLGREFQKEILGKMGKSKGRYPYVIIADGLGCNLRCWFCYAYKFFDKKSAEENNCSFAYVTPKRLAEQFGCKLEKLSDFNALIKAVQRKNIDERDKKTAIKHLQMKLPLMRIRISGGEPIFSTKDTIIDPTNPDLIKSTISYWLAFFEELDKIVGKLKKDGKLHIIDKLEVKNKGWKEDLPFPTCLAERLGRLNIRFDTNGILFGDREITENFIGGLFKLFKENKLNNIFIEIDYSFKGATPVEYNWSQRRDLPVDSSKINFNYKLEEHPQLLGYFNITHTIDKYCSTEKNFSNCIGITVERGINHHIPYKTYLNCKESLDWGKFSEKTGIKFSVVDNPIEMFNWRNWKPKACFIENGANIKIISSKEVFNLEDNPDFTEFDNFRRKHLDCYFVIYPIKDKITLKKPKRKKKIKLPRGQLRLIPTGVWLLVGNEKNWEIGIKNSIWGLKEKHRTTWEMIKKGDSLFIYVTAPISGLIGVAKVKEKILGEKPLWPDEISADKIIYPFRIIFEIEKIVEREKWKKEKISIWPILGYRRLHGINELSEREAKGLLKLCGKEIS